MAIVTVLAAQESFAAETGWCGRLSCSPIPKSHFSATEENLNPTVWPAARPAQTAALRSSIVRDEQRSFRPNAVFMRGREAGFGLKHPAEAAGARLRLLKIDPALRHKLTRTFMPLQDANPDQCNSSGELWIGQLSSQERAAFVATFAGWTLDGMDVMVYSLVLP